MSEEAEIVGVICLDTGALALTTQRGRIRGEENWISMPLASLWSDFEDGRARSVRFFRSWDEALEAAGLPTG